MRTTKPPTITPPCLVACAPPPAGDITQDQASTLIETAAETSGITFNFEEGLDDVDFIIYSAFGFLSPAW